MSDTNSMDHPVLGPAFPVVSREQGRRLGLARHFTGKPCKRGHIAERYVNSGCCICMHERRRAKYNANPDERRAMRAAAVRWREANPGKYRQQMRKVMSLRRARRRAATIGDQKSIAAVFHLAATAVRIRCYYCGRRTNRNNRHVDHIQPLALGGTHSAGNLCITCPGCNLSKNTKTTYEFTGQGEMGLV